MHINSLTVEASSYTTSKHCGGTIRYHRGNILLTLQLDGYKLKKLWQYGS